MANCKEANLKGVLPFDYYNTTNLASTMAFIQSPTSGFDISFEEDESVPNDHGGRTLMYKFTLSGTEAVSWDWFHHFKDCVEESGGRVFGDASDIECGTDDKLVFKEV